MHDTLADLWFRLLNLCRKEFLAVLKDPKSRTILVMPALVQSLLFGYAATYDLNDVPYALVDDSRSAASAQLAAKLDGTGVFRRVATANTPAAERHLVDTQQVLLVLHIPRDFERRLHAGEQVPVQLILDGRNSNTAESAASHVAAVVADFNRQWRERHGGGGAPLEVAVRAWFNPNLETRWNLMPGLIASLSMLQTLLLTALSVAREREQGTFDQLLVTPMTPAEIMLGKALPPVCIGLLQSTLILLVTRFWFQVPMAGSVVSLYAALALFTVACVGIGLAISAVAASMQQAMLYTFVLVMPLMLLSGLTTPVRNMPALMQTLTWANPLRFAIDMVQRIYLEGAGLAAVRHDMVPLLVIAAITLPYAAWLFRHRLV